MQYETETTGGQKLRGNMKQVFIIMTAIVLLWLWILSTVGNFHTVNGEGGRRNDVGAYCIRPGDKGNSVIYCSGAQALRSYDANVFTTVLISLIG